MSDSSVSREEFNRLYAQVNGNGQPGIKQAVDGVATDVAEIKAVQQERQRVDARRWVLMTVILGTLTLVVGVLTLMQANHALKTGELSWPHSPHKSLYVDHDPVVASRQSPPEDAIIHSH
jgi:hypothetical protein